MNKQTIQIDPSMVRDVNSKAININDENTYNKHILQKTRRQELTRKIMSQDERINNLEEEVKKLQTCLEILLNSQKPIGNIR